MEQRDPSPQTEPFSCPSLPVLSVYSELNTVVPNRAGKKEKMLVEESVVCSACGRVNL